MSRLYDPHKPRMLTREEVARLNPVECAAACEELDQNILSTLQSIDANFAETTRIVTDVLIPIVEKYGSSSKHVWDSIKLWKAFFEASAGVSSGPGGLDEGDYEEEQEEAGDTTARGHEHEQQQESFNDYAEEGNSTAMLEPVKPKKTKSHKSKRVSTTPPSSSSSEDDAEEDQQHEFILPPRKPGKQADGRGVEPSWADDTSPFEQLRQDIQKVRIDASYSTSSSYHAPPFAPSSIAAKKQQQQQVQEEQNNKKHQTRLRDLSMDSPDFERPALQTMSFQHPRERLTQQYNQAPVHNAHDKGKGRAYQGHLDEAEEDDSTDASSAVPDTPAGISTLSDLSSLGGPSGGETRPGMPHRKSSGTNNQNALLQKVLMKNLVGKDGRPNLSTPATKRMSKSINKARKSQIGQLGQEEEEVPFYPKDLPSDWNGLADLSKAPLSAFESPQKKSTGNIYGNQRSASRNRVAYATSSSKPGLPSSISSDSLFDNSIFRDESGIPVASGSTNERYQPPVFSAYKSRLSRTPAKEAARLITRDVLQKASLRDGGGWEDAGMDSPPLDPPSVVKNWATRGYTTHFPPPGSAQKVLPTEGSAKHDQSHRSQLLVPLAEGEDSFEAEFEDEQAGLPAPPPQPNFGHLADEGDEHVQEGGGFNAGEASGNGDDWGDSFEGRSGEDDDDNSGFDEPAQIPLNDEQGGAEEGDSFSDISRSLDDETVFGAKRGRVSNDPNQLGYGLHPSDALDPNSRQAHLFRLQAQNDMVTLHGGNLLESQPFEASPLAGRDARYGL
ncbi:hypothetical protein P389DRAFT_16939 [Cystobasidium minutum MCA 4210]|uniref:uncharacterized protein n=1 Tax=Cystobasidium minutum MCA 4210 TaxID=1397322 RepID=UPI0034CE119A|eukprot:jgi/Rhomi1/16939/CE16938_262